MIQFIHTADVHYGMENYGKIDTTTGIHSRLLDFDKAFNACIDYAIQKNVDFFLFAGDAYKTTLPSPTQQRLLLRSLMRLHSAQIPVIIVVGNHDNPLSFGKATTLDLFKDLPLNGFHIFSKPGMCTLLTRHGPIQIVGIPWPTRNTLSLHQDHMGKSALEITNALSSRVAKIIEHFAQCLNPDIPAILCGHLTVASGIFSGSEKQAIYGTDPVLLPSQLAIKPFDYVGLGHLHRFQNLNPNGTIPVIYSGSIERIDFGERKEEKGFCYVSISKKYQARLSFIKTPQRPFIQIEVHISTQESQTSKIIEKIKTYSIKSAIIKIIYHLAEGLNDNVDLAAVQRFCSAAQDIVAIIPVHHVVSRKSRAQMRIDMKFEDMLESYINMNKKYLPKKSILIKKAQELMYETDN